MDKALYQVLLIEDNPGDAELIAELLAGIGPSFAQLTQVNNLAAGLERLQQGGQNVVLLDLSLPDSQGLDTLLEVLRRAAEVAVIILTGMEEKNLAKEAVRLGAQDFLVKGHLTSDLLERAIHYARERLQAIEQLRQREAHLRLLSSQLPAIVWTTDTHLRITSSRGAGLEGLNMHPDEAVGSTMHDFFPGDKGESPVVAAHRQALAGTKVTLETIYQGKTFQAHIEPLRHQSNGQIMGTIGVALDVTASRRLQEELRIAQRIQKGLLPSKMPSWPPFEAAGVSFPAEATGGDYFDFITLPDGNYLIVVGDVSGHGFGPALLMASTRAHLHALTRLTTDLTELLRLLNDLLVEDIPDDRFVTLLLASLDPNTRTLTYASAGHTTGYVLDASGTVKTQMTSTGLPLGIMPQTSYVPAAPLVLQPEELVLLFTDGVQEAVAPALSPEENGGRERGEEFGLERALLTVRRFRQDSAPQIVDNLFHTVRAFSQNAPQDDDITVVVLKVGPT